MVPESKVSQLQRRGRAHSALGSQYLSVVQLSVHIDLALGDIPSQVGDGMSDICQGRQDALRDICHLSVKSYREQFSVMMYLCCLIV